jgi:hypothetical protein
MFFFSLELILWMQPLVEVLELCLAPVTKHLGSIPVEVIGHSYQLF